MTRLSGEASPTMPAQLETKMRYVHAGYAAPRLRKASPTRNACYPALSHSEVFRFEPGMFRDARQHPGADFFSLMKSEHDVRPAFPEENTVRTGLPLYLPPTLEQCPENLLSSRALPAAHAAVKVMLLNSAPASPCSSLSATTRKAKA